MIILPKNLNVTKINLSGLDLKEIPQEVFRYKNLRKLYLQNNKIGRIPEEIKQLKLLTVLDLSSNNLTSMHAKIFELKWLEVLILNRNKIKNIPPQIKKLQKLRILGLANNKFVKLNEYFILLANLKEINLSGNGFVAFPNEILDLKNLERLWFCNYEFDIPNFSFLKRYLPYLKKVYKSSALESIPTENKLNKGTTGTKNEELVKNNLKIDKNKKIFISYSHQDKDWLEKVEKHLKVLSMYSGLDFEVWSDKRIASGQKWKEEIEKELKVSTAAILLISTDFLISDFIHNEELQPLLEKAEKEGTLILQLIINPCGFKRIKSLNIFQTVNNPKTETLIQLTPHEQDLIFEKLTDEVEMHIKN